VAVRNLPHLLWLHSSSGIDFRASYMAMHVDRSRHYHIARQINFANGLSLSRISRGIDYFTVSHPNVFDGSIDTVGRVMDFATA
jgi:hypothetical protein